MKIIKNKEIWFGEYLNAYSWYLELVNLIRNVTVENAIVSIESDVNNVSKTMASNGKYLRCCGNGLSMI